MENIRYEKSYMKSLNNIEVEKSLRSVEISFMNIVTKDTHVDLDRISEICFLTLKEKNSLKNYIKNKFRCHPGYISKIYSNKKLVKKLKLYFENKKKYPEAILETDITLSTGNVVSVQNSSDIKTSYKKGSRIILSYFHEKSNLYVFWLEEGIRFPLTDKEFSWV